MAIFASFVHCLPNILHTWPHDSFQVIRLSMTLGIFQDHWTVSHQISQKRCVIRQKLLYRQLIGNHTLAFDWCHFWWPWSTFEGHFSLGCHFHVHFSYPWHAFASHGLPAIAELLVGKAFIPVFTAIIVIIIKQKLKWRNVYGLLGHLTNKAKRVVQQQLCSSSINSTVN